MKTKDIFSRAFMVPLIIASALFITSCSKDSNNNNNSTMYSISGNASGSQETPSNTVTGTGTLSGTYNSSTNVLNYTITWTGLTGLVTVAHFHGPANAGVSASPIIDITISTNGISGTVTGSATLDATTESYLLNGKIYYNLHTATYPAGEIRGQITAVAQ